MTVRNDRRAATLDRMADHLLARGLADTSLKALADAAGTSDRMLLYYFADKAELLTAALERIAARLTARLDGALSPGARLRYDELLATVTAAMRSPELEPYMFVWLELAAGAARGREPHRTIAGGIVDGFVGWLTAHLDGSEAATARDAARLLAAVDGLMLLDAVGRRDLADLAAP